jgi:uncharacterized protein YbaP (TraB family)
VWWTFASRTARLRAGFAFIFVALFARPTLAQQGSTPLVYEVRSPTTTLYLFGTLHVGTPALYPLGRQVEEAFASASVLALEADPTNQGSLMQATASAMYSPPDTLANHIPPELYRRLESMLPGVGLPIEYARAMKPYLLAMTLAMLEVQRLGYDPMLGLDMHLARRASTQGKRIVELESLAQQMALFDELDAGVQAAMLAVTIDAVAQRQLDAELKELVAAWSQGDAEGIERSVTRELEELPNDAASVLRERLYNRRNYAMADKVSVMLAGREIVFVAVGAGHLTGRTGLPELLRKQGFVVRRL